MEVNERFIYEINSPDTYKRQFTGEWSSAMRVTNKLHENGIQVRVFKAPVVGELTIEKLGRLMNLAVAAQANQQEGPLFANSVVMYSDFGDEGQHENRRFEDIQPEGSVRLEDIEPGRGPSASYIRPVRGPVPHDENA